MGRTRTKSKKAALISEVPAPQAKAENGPSISALLEKTQSLITQCDYELASKFAGRILEKDAANCSAREMLGICQLELGELYAAKETFQSLIPPHPLAPTSPPPLAYQYLAQLSVGDAWQALKLYEASIELLHTRLKGKDRATANAGNNSMDEEDKETRSSIVKALVSMVEIWMDPQYELCDLPEAEQTCQDLLEKAKQVDPENVEALQMLASVRMSQSRPDEARQCLELAWAQWKDLEIDDVRMPTQETRLQFVKLCLELSLFSPALVAFQGFMANDDQDVEAWYLEGWCFFLMAEQAREDGVKIEDLSWEELARDARDCLETCSVLHSNQDHPDHPMLAHVQELISQLDVLGIKPSPLDEDEDEQGDWEDASDEDDVEMS